MIISDLLKKWYIQYLKKVFSDANNDDNNYSEIEISELITKCAYIEKISVNIFYI